MEHIGNTLAMTDKLKGRNLYTPEYFRAQLPHLNRMEVTDEAIQRGAILLLDLIKQDKICGQCKGFELCGKEGDAKGLYDFLDLYHDQLTIRTAHCPQYMNFVERREIESLNEYAIKTSEDRRYTFRNYPLEQQRKSPELFAAAMEFADSFKVGNPGELKGLYIFGPPGVGKTHLMLAICNRLDERQIPNIFVRADTVFDKLRMAVGAGKDMEAVIEKYCNVPVLAIDEFAQERANEFTLDKMFRIINYRFSNKLPTLFTSNYEPPVVYRTFSQDTKTVEAMISRIIQMSRIGRLAGADYRLSQMDILDRR